MTGDQSLELAADGIGAPPRLNGELIFDAPWQSRAFGMAAALADSGRLDWAEFQTALIERVAGADATGTETGDPTVYWGSWLDALTGLVTDPARGTGPALTAAGLADRSDRVAHGWSHQH